MTLMRPRNVARNSQRMAFPKKKSTGPRADASMAARSAAGNSTERAGVVVGVDAGAAAIISWTRSSQSNWVWTSGWKPQALPGLALEQEPEPAWELQVPAWELQVPERLPPVVELVWQAPPVRRESEALRRELVPEWM